MNQKISKSAWNISCTAQFIFKNTLHLSMALPETEWFCTQTGRREVPGSNLGSACRPSRSQFSVVFSEIRVNTG